MRKIKLLCSLVLFGFLLHGCQTEDILYSPPQNYTTVSLYSKTAVGFPETMESGSKTSYATADVTLSTGSWNFNDALIGTLASDHKNGTKAARIQNSGMLTMNFDVSTGASQVTVSYAAFGTDAGSTFGLWYSTNAGLSWIQTGSNVTVSASTLNTVVFDLAIEGDIRFQLRKLSGGRLNIDDFSISDYVTPPKIYVGFPETMDSGSKTSYAAADVSLATGSWNFNDALIGSLASDHKNGTKAARIQNSGMLTMNFDLSSGASEVTVSYAAYGTDAGSSFGLWYSTDAGLTWTQTGSDVVVSDSSLNTATFALAVEGSVRFQLRKLSGGRLNIDDFGISDYNANTLPPDGDPNPNPLPSDNDHIALGNPSGALTDVAYPNNYLLKKPQYDLAYDNSRGTCAWVSWHLDATDLGTVPRCDCFSQDLQLPSSFYRASSTAYSGSGFDRGHQCPSADRNDTAANNAETFLMTDMLPQAPNLNRITWVALENYERALVNQGNEVYIISGGYGSGGTGSNGGTTTTINGGLINVPSHCWKIIVIMPVGNNDVSRVTTSTRVIAVDMPNIQTVNSQAWDYYRVSVDAIENATGYDFLSNIPSNIQNAIESTIDYGPTN